MHTIGISSNDPTVVIPQARDPTDSLVTSVGKQIWRVINGLCCVCCMGETLAKNGGSFLRLKKRVKIPNIRSLTSDHPSIARLAGSLTWDGESPTCSIFMIQDREELRLSQEAVK